MTETPKDAFISIETVHFVDREIQKHHVLTDEKFERLREVLQARFDSVSKAQDLAYIELQRRLDMLNHAHEEAKQKETHFLPRENFEQFFKDFGTWRDVVNATLSNQAGRMAAYAGVIVFIFGVIGIALHFWK